MEKALNIRISVPKNWKQIRKRNHFRHGKTLDKTFVDQNQDGFLIKRKYNKKYLNFCLN